MTGLTGSHVALNAATPMVLFETLFCISMFKRSSATRLPKILLFIGAFITLSSASAKGSGIVTNFPAGNVIQVDLNGKASAQAANAPMASYLGPAEAPMQIPDYGIKDDSSSIVFLQTEIYRVKPTLLEDIGTSAQWASESWWSSGDIEKRFAEALRLAYIRDGNFATSVSSPYSVHPTNYSLAQELAFREEMAQSLKHFMILRGIPKLLASREETRELGKKYEKTMQTVATFATVKVETKDKWVFNSGINPLTMVGWMGYSNGKWNFEGDSNLNTQSLDVFMQRNFKRNYSGEMRWKMLEKCMITSATKVITANLRIYASNVIPYSDTQNILKNLTDSVGLGYSF